MDITDYFICTLPNFYEKEVVGAREAENFFVSRAPYHINSKKGWVKMKTWKFLLEPFVSISLLWAAIVVFFGIKVNNMGIMIWGCTVFLVPLWAFVMVILSARKSNKVDRVTNLIFSCFHAFQKKMFPIRKNLQFTLALNATQFDIQVVVHGNVCETKTWDPDELLLDCTSHAVYFNSNSSVLEGNYYKNEGIDGIYTYIFRFNISFIMLMKIAPLELFLRRFFEAFIKDQFVCLDFEHDLDTLF